MIDAKPFRFHSRVPGLHEGPQNFVAGTIVCGLCSERQSLKHLIPLGPWSIQQLENKIRDEMCARRPQEEREAKCSKIRAFSDFASNQAGGNCKKTLIQATI